MSNFNTSNSELFNHIHLIFGNEQYVNIIKVSDVFGCTLDDIYECINEFMQNYPENPKEHIITKDDDILMSDIAFLWIALMLPGQEAMQFKLKFHALTQDHPDLKNNLYIEKLILDKLEDQTQQNPTEQMVSKLNVKLQSRVLKLDNLLGRNCDLRMHVEDGQIFFDLNSIFAFCDIPISPEDEVLQMIKEKHPDLKASVPEKTLYYFLLNYHNGFLAKTTTEIIPDYIDKLMEA